MSAVLDDPKTEWSSVKVRWYDGRERMLEMVSGKTSLRLLIDRPEMVLVRGRADGTVDLRCEAQDQALTVGFVPGVNMTHQTEGHVRVLDYGK